MHAYPKFSLTEAWAGTPSKELDAIEEQPGGRRAQLEDRGAWTARRSAAAWRKDKGVRLKVVHHLQRVFDVAQEPLTLCARHVLL